MSQWAKETKNDINQSKTKLKHKLENKTKAECQLGNKGKKAKQNNKHIGKTEKKGRKVEGRRKNRKAKLNRSI